MCAFVFVPRSRRTSGMATLRRAVRRLGRLGRNAYLNSGGQLGPKLILAQLIHAAPDTLLVASDRRPLGFRLVLTSGTYCGLYNPLSGEGNKKAL